MFVPSFLALWWPKIDRKSGFPQLFGKTVGSIHFIPGIYTYGVSPWTPIDFRVRALIFGPLVAKNWPKIGVSATFRENCRLDSFHPRDLYFWGKSLDPYRFSCSCPHFWPSGGQKLTENRGFRNFSWKLFLRFPNFLYQLQPRYLPYHDTLVGRVMPKFFSNKFFLNDSHQCSYHNDLKIGHLLGISWWGGYWSERGYIVPIYGHSLFAFNHLTCCLRYSLSSDFCVAKIIWASTVSESSRYWQHHSNYQITARLFHIMQDMPCNLLYPPLQRSWKGVILVLCRLSVCLSVCGQNRVRSVSSTILAGSIHICTSHQTTLRGVSHVKVIVKCQNLNFWHIFGICSFDFVLLWHGIWYVWLWHGIWYG